MKRLNLPPVLCVLLSLIPRIASSDQCGDPVVVPGATDYIHSAVLDTSLSQYIAYKQGQTLTIASVSRDPSLHLNTIATLPIPQDSNVSVGFSAGDAAVSFSRIVSAQPDNQTPEELSWISYYRLSDGSLNTARTFRASALDLLPAPSNAAPFYSSNWPFVSWQAPLCAMSNSMRTQQGRVIAASGARVIVMNNGEQFNSCNSDPNYYLFHLSPMGDPLTPILPSEHCPTCPYWWYELDPGGLIRISDGSTLRFGFPTSIPSPDGGYIIPPQNLRFGAINALEADPSDGGFAMAIDLDPSGFPARNVGGIMFFDGSGGFRGMGTTFANNARLGDSGALAALGRVSAGEIVYAAGSGRNVPAGAGGFNVPVQFQTEFRPEGGHVGYFHTNGEQFQLDFGDHANDGFGSSLAALGDINNDREPDILVGAPGGNYASVISVVSNDEQSTRGIMYRFTGPQNSRFGQQVASLSTAQSGHADVIAVGANDALRLYDVGACLGHASPALGLRETLRRVVPQAKAALVPVPPRRADRGAVNRFFLELHPALNDFFFKFAAVINALDASNETLPSNEAARSFLLETSWLSLNSALNKRDKNMILLQRIQPQLLSAARRCPPSQRRRGRSQACRDYRRLLALSNQYNANITQARTDINTTKGVQNAQYDEIMAELSSL